MKKITLLTLFSVFTTLMYGQCPDNPPAYDSDQYFCSTTAWALIGETGDMLSDLQIFADELGWTINWYADDNGNPGAAIANPNNEVLVSGAVYHVTQENTVGCESDPLMITLTERDCACIKDPTFEDQNGNPSARGYNFYRFPGVTHHKTCAQSMAGAPVLPMGTIDGFFPAGVDPMGLPPDDAVLVTPGPDPSYINRNGVVQGTLPITRTNPDNPASAYALRINRGAEYGGVPIAYGSYTAITAGHKKFVAGEVISFAFSLVIQDPGHTPVQQPFAQVRLYDSNNNRLVQRCLVSDSDDCIFKSQGSGFSTVLYSDWTCMKINTSEWQGEPLTMEIIVAYCSPTQHFSYIYVDDIYVGEDYDGLCDGPAFGYALIDKVETIGQNCFITQPPTLSGGCVPLLSGTVPGFPLEVCGVFVAPVSQQDPPTLDDVRLTIIQNDVVVGTFTNSYAGSDPDSFCFTVNDTDINVLPYGDFTFKVDLDFLLDCGDPYIFPIDDRNTFTLCPAASCSAPLVVCDTDGTGFGNFDLTDADADIRGTWDVTELDITYFDNEQDAHDNTSPIPDPTDFNNTTPDYQVVYARLDWNLPGITSDCYYIAEVELMIRELPQLVWDDEMIICGNIQTTLIATPSNLTDLGTVTYRWFKDGVQLPHAGSAYNVTQSGDYTVVVSNMGCEHSQTITVDKVDFEVDLGPDVAICDQGGSTYVLSPTVTPAPGTTFDINDATYLWSTGETTPSITVTIADHYWVEVTYEGCTVIDDVMMNIAVQPMVTLGADIVKCKNETVVLQAMVTNMDTSHLDFTWYDGGSTPIGTGSTLQVTDIFGGEADYTVIVYDPLSPACYGEDTINVKYFSNENCIITQGISPDSSPGFNDNLDLEFLAQRTGIASLQIFNRHGSIVYEYSNYKNEWAGQSKNGDLLPTGLYYYVINLSGNDPVFGTQHNGYVYINRAAN